MECLDKMGEQFIVREYRQGDHPGLIRMYGCFTPKGRFQGMPPVEEDRCLAWADRLLETGQNFLALREDMVIGHLILMPDYQKRDAEYLIFVNKPDRNKGVGTHLTRIALQKARVLDLSTLWLTVATYNFPAIGLYRKFGFRFDEGDRCERERVMVLRVTEEHDA